MDRFRTILSKAGVFSRLNRFSQTARPLSTQYTDSRRTNINSFSFRGESKNRFSQCFVQCNHLHRSFASEVKSETQSVSQVDFEHYCAETLESLTDYFDQLVEEFKELEAADVVCKDGVLTVNLGRTYGIYVINKQTPNKQIWLSSPRSGPKRFDYVPSSDGSEHGYWVYKHSGIALHELLDEEMGEIVSAQTGFQQLPFGRRQ